MSRKPLVFGGVGALVLAGALAWWLVPKRPPPQIGAFSTPVPISQDGARAFLPRAVASPEGGLTAVWVALGGGHSKIVLREWAEEKWGAASPVTGEGNFPLGAALAMNGSRRPHVVFVNSRDKKRRLFHSAREAGGWSAPEDLSLRGLDTYSPAAAIDGNGGLHVLWNIAHGHNGAIVYRNRPGRFWDHGGFLASGGKEFTFWKPSLVMDDAENLHAAFVRIGKEGARVAYSRKDKGGKWGPVELVSEGVLQAADPAIGADGEGNPYIFWRGGKRQVEFFYSFREQGRWEPPRQMGVISHRAGPPATARSAKGTILVAWVVPREKGGAVMLREGRGDDWGEPQAVSPETSHPVGVALAAGGGRIHLLWAEVPRQGKGTIVWSAAKARP